MTSGSQTLSGFPHRRESLAELRFICLESCDRHCSSHSQSAHRCEPFSYAAHFFQIEPALRLFPRRIHLDEHIDRFAAIAAEAVDGVSEAHAVECMKEIEALQRFDLVALKVTDQMPFHRHLDIGHLGQRFLHPVLADILYACRVCCGHSLGSVSLRDSNDGHLLTMSASLDGRRNPLSNRHDSPSKVRKEHSCQIYRDAYREAIPRMEANCTNLLLPLRRRLGTVQSGLLRSQDSHPWTSCD